MADPVYDTLGLVRKYDLDLDGFSITYNGPMRLAVSCSDVFAWGMADMEVIESEDILGLESMLKRVQQIEETLVDSALLIWVAHKRNMRPQGAAYSLVPEQLWDLLDEAGPYRETGLGNPYEPGQYPKA